MTLLWKPTGRGNTRGLTPKSEKQKENSEDKKSMTEETRCSLTASDKGSYHRDGRQNLPITRKVSERAGKISLERKKEGY